MSHMLRFAFALSALSLAVPAYAHGGPAATHDDSATAAARLDTVTLTNGDVIRGRILGVNANYVTVASAWLGDVEIPVGDVADLHSYSPVHLLTNAGEPVEANLGGLSDGVVDAAGRKLPLASLAAPQDDPEEEDPLLAGETEWNFNVAVGAALSNGNTERRSANASITGQRRTTTDRTTAGFYWTYAEDKASGDWTLTERRTAGEIQHDIFLSECDYIWGSLFAENNRFQDLDLRFIAGAGYGRQILDDECLKLSGELGLSYIDESRIFGTDSENLAARVAYSLFWAIQDGVRLIQDVEAYPSLEEKEDFFGRKITRIQVDWLENMFIEGRWEADYDNTPSQGLDRIDNRFFLNVGWAFGPKRTS